MPKHSLAARRAALAVGTALAALAAPALAQQAPGQPAPVLLFSSTKPGVAIVPGRPVKTTGGTTQFRMPGGAVVSLVGAADFTVTPAGALELRAGSATVANDGTSPLLLALPGGVSGSISPHGAASLNTSGTGGSGSVLGGTLTLGGSGGQRSFGVGSFWSATGASITRQGAGTPARVVDAPAKPPAATTPPAPASPAIRQASTSQWLQAGFPAALAQQLAAAGANAEVIAAARHLEAYAANPTVAAFPRGDYALLATQAAQAARLYGQPAFNGAQADIITAYFQFLASGRAGSGFLAAYSQILVSYLDLLRAGTLPSSFSGASQAQLNAWLGYLGRTSGYGALSADNQTLLNAYLGFLKGGGAPDSFTTTLSSLTAAYLDYVRAGNDPATFTRLSQSVLVQYLAIVQSGGIKGQLSAQNQAFIDAYIASLKANGDGLAFLATQATALNAYLAYLQAGGLPSQYTALDQASLRAYFQALVNAGLLTLKLGQNAAFYQAYYSYLASGGAADAYAQLPANLWASYATALNAYYAYLAAGGLPSQYAQLTQAQIQSYLQTLLASGRFAALLGGNAGFFNGYYSYLAAGGAPNSYAGLPASSGGGSAGSGSGTAGLTGYSGGFPATGSASFYTSASSSGGFGGGWFASYKPALNANGTLVQSGTATASEVAGDPLGVIGRYAGGTFTGPQGSGTIAANSGVSFAYLAPITGTLPTDGTVVNYDLIAATRPVYTDGHTAPGTLGATLAFQLGATLGYRMSGTVTMADATYTFASPGAAQGSFVAPQVSSPANFIVLRPTLSASGPACTGSGCYLNFYGGFAGATPQQRAGFAYLSFDPANSSNSKAIYLDGAAMFAAPGTYGASAGAGAGMGGAGTGGAGAGSTGGSGAAAGGSGAATGTPVPASNVAWSVRSGGSLGVVLAAGSLAYATDNTVQSFKQTVSGFSFARNTAAVIDTASVDGMVGWARWGNGSVNYAGLGETLAGGKYVQAAWGVPATNYPTSGLVTYALASASAPTQRDGLGGDGSFTGNLAVDFATLKLGLDSTVTVNGKSYQLATTGGVAAPSLTVNVTGNGEFQPLWFSGTTANTASAGGTIAGLLAGPGANYAALTYQVLVFGGPQIIGAATFKAATPAVTSTPSASPDSVPPAGTGAPIGVPMQIRTVGLPFDLTSGAAATNGTFETTSAAINGSASGTTFGQLHEIATPVVQLSQGTATIPEYGGAGDVIGWSRWSGGTVTRGNGASYTIAANAGLSSVWGTPVSALPSSGTITYTWFEGTQPVQYQGNAAPGYTADASLVVAFGAAPKAGLNANIMFNGTAYNVASAGGTGNPSMAINAAGSFAESTATQQISGFLAGPGAAYAGVGYSLTAPGVSGTLVFRKGP